MARDLYTDTEWALRDNVRELRDLLTSLGLDKDLAMATLERLLSDEILYDVSDSDRSEETNG